MPKEALNESNLARDDVLARVHADLPRMFREKCVAGLARLVAAIEAGQPDSQEIRAATQLLDDWDDWVRDHKNELRFPKGVPN